MHERVVGVGMSFIKSLKNLTFTGVVPHDTHLVTCVLRQQANDQIFNYISKKSSCSCTYVILICFLS